VEARSLSAVQWAWLLGLLALWAVLLFGGFAFGKVDAKRTRRMPAWTRLGSSLVLAVAAWSSYAFVRETALGGAMLLVAVGMTCGFAGDVALAEVLPIRRSVLAGMAAFGLGHIAYIAGLLLAGNQLHLDAVAPRWVALACWLLVGVVGWYMVVRRGHEAQALHWAALPYALLLAGTAGVASGIALQAPTFIPVAIGGALFLLSDLILAAQLFNGAYFPLNGDATWLTYGPAQALIVYGVGAALTLGAH
jgi:YhhN family